MATPRTTDLRRYDEVQRDERGRLVMQALLEELRVLLEKPTRTEVRP